MQKILVTGAAGFAGQHLLKTLSGQYRTIGLTHSPKTSQKYKNTIYIQGDIANPSFVKDTLANYKPDAILHLAALTKSWFRNTKNLFKVNLFGTLNLYDAVVKLKKTNGYSPKILYISTSEIYGNTTDPKNIKENSPLLPMNFYSSSKAAADRASYAYSQAANLNIAILRPFTHTGPGQEKGFFVPDMASQIASIENSEQKGGLLVGNLETVRDYLDVRDVVEAYKLMIETDWESGEVFNICSGHGAKMKGLLNILLSFSNKKIRVEKDPKKFRPVDVPVYIGNGEKIKKLTAWRPKIKIEKTLKDTLNYWREKSIK